MTSKKQRKVPELRFRGFTDDWEQRKLGELVNVHSGFAGDASLREGRYQLTRIETISDGEVNLAKIGFSNDRPSRAFLLRVGDILYSNINSIDHIGKTALYGKDVGLYHGINLLRLAPSARVDSEFLFQSLNTTPHRQWAMRHANRAVSQASINQTALSEQIFLVPKLSEQKQISSFLTKLDNTIALHQRKQSLLEKLKQGYLQKLFPQKGQRQPELRFSGFTDDWEQRKLEDCATYRRGSFPQPYGYKKWYDGAGSMPFVQVVDVTDNLQLVSKTKQQISALAQPQSVFVPAGKVIVTLQGSIGRVAITQYNAYVDRTLLIFEAFMQRTDISFWAYTIQNKFEVEKRLAPGGTIKTITKQALSSFEVSMPSFSEQQKIGSLLSRLDDTIALHQQEIDRLQQFKQGYLQKMFV